MSSILNSVEDTLLHGDIEILRKEINSEIYTKYSELIDALQLKVDRHEYMNKITDILNNIIGEQNDRISALESENARLRTILIEKFDIFW